MMTEDFLNYLRYERNRSELTVRRYEQGLRDFETYFKNRDSQLSWESVDSDVIRDWMESMMDKGDMGDPSYVVKGPKKQKPLPQFVREEDMNRLLDTPQMWEEGFVGLRARTIIILFYETGIRLAELIGLDVEDVDLATRQLKVTGKRNKQRIVPFGEELETAIREYLKQRDRLSVRIDDALILSDKGKRMTRSQVEKIVKQHLSLTTTLKKRSPHVLRHSFATAMLNNGAGLESVRRLLGHESVATTQIYTHTTFEQLKRIYETAHPRA